MVVAELLMRKILKRNVGEKRKGKLIQRVAGRAGPQLHTNIDNDSQWRRRVKLTKILCLIGFVHQRYLNTYAPEHIRSWSPAKLGYVCISIKLLILQGQSWWR